MPETVTEKKYLKGFTGACYWPVTQNDTAGYTAGAVVELVGAQNLTKETQYQEFTIYADDGVYDTGNEYQYETLTFTVAELPVELESKLSGGTFDAATKTYHFKNTNTAPEVGFGYAALMSNEQYKMFKHYAAKLMSVKIDHATRGDNNSAQAYQLTLRNTNRKCDGMVRDTREGTDGTYGWLKTVEDVSDTPED